MSMNARALLQSGRAAWARHDGSARLLGVYLVVHFVWLLPNAAELFSSEGMLPDAHLSPLVRAFPNVLAIFDAPAFVQGFVGLGIVASVGLAGGRWTRGSSLVLLYVWACLLGRNPLIRNPSIPFVGLMLLSLVLEPSGGRSVDPSGDADTRAMLRRAVLVVLALAYGYSGVTKLASATWVSGDAFGALLQTPLARDTALRGALLAIPPGLGALATYGVMGVELLYTPLSIVPRLRRPLSVLMVAMHLGLVVLIDFADLSVAMLLVHVFTWDATGLTGATNVAR